MKKVYLSNDDIIDCINFANYTVSQHYKRMWQNENDGILKIILGKLGELSISKYCEMIGIKTKTNFRIDTGIDTADLIIHKKNIAVKSKNFKRMMLPPLSNIWLHIPIDQYPKIIEHNTVTVIAVCLHSNNNQVKEWAMTPFCTTNIIGGLLIGEYDKLKILHRAGEEISPGFRLPPPNSWAVPWSELYDFDILLHKIKQCQLPYPFKG